MADLLSIRTPRSFSTEMLCSRSTSNLYWCRTLALVQLHLDPFRPALKPIQVLLNGSTELWCISHFARFCIISKLAEGIPYLFFQVIGEDAE